MAATNIGTDFAALPRCPCDAPGQGEADKAEAPLRPAERPGRKPGQGSPEPAKPRHGWQQQVRLWGRRSAPHPPPREAPPPGRHAPPPVPAMFRARQWAARAAVSRAGGPGPIPAP